MSAKPLLDQLIDSPLADYLEAYVWVVSPGREWGDPDSADMTAMVERVASYKPDQEPNYYFTFGYLQAWAVHQLLEEAVANGDLSRDGVVEAMDGMATVDFGDLLPPYTYGPPADRNPSRSTSVFEVNREKPFALGVIASDVTAPEAEAYEFG